MDIYICQTHIYIYMSLLGWDNTNCKEILNLGTIRDIVVVILKLYLYIMLLSK